MTPIDLVLGTLRDRGYSPRKTGDGWSCRCPAHEDRNPSLSIAVGDNGRVLLKCHAGCTVDAICERLGLPLAELFLPPSDGHKPVAARGPSASAVNENTEKPARNGNSVDKRARVFSSADAAVEYLEHERGPCSRRWTYADAAGVPVGLVVRWNTDTGKDVRPVSRNADGSGWYIGGMPTPRPLYGLPALLATPAGSRVYVTEGEKAADAVRSVGLVATTSAQGAKSAKGSDWSPLAGRDVVILPDHDDAGEGYADGVARLATTAGAKSVRIVRLVELWPGMPEGGDMADFVDDRDSQSSEEIVAQIEALADRTEAETVTPNAPAVPAFKPFPVHVLPEPIRGFIAEGAKAIGCDPSYIALPLLSALASAIGNTHRIELKRGWTEPAIVWTAIVGDSGTAKSPALELALRPIRKRQHNAMKEHAEAMKQHADALAMYERDAAHWKKSKSDTPPPTKPEAPIADRCWTDDVTTEALAVLLQQNPRGLLLSKDELAGWFNFDRYTGGKGGGDAAKWLEMFGGRPVVVDRKMGGTLYVPRAAVSITGSIQPKTLRRALGQEHRDNGLAARLLLTCPPHKAKRWTEADVDAKTEAAVAMVFDRLFGMTSESGDDGDDRPRLLKLADDGKAAWMRFYDEHGTEQAELSGDLSAAWSKLEGYAARLALVVHLTRWAAGDTTLIDPSQVDEASIAAGVVLARWFGDEARRVYAILSESDDDRETRLLVELIQRKGGDVSGRELVHASRMFPTVADAEAALTRLVEAGAGSWVTPTQRGRGGPKSRRFKLAPVYSVNAYRNHTCDGENGNSVDVDTVDDRAEPTDRLPEPGT